MTQNMTFALPRIAEARRTLKLLPDPDAPLTPTPRDDATVDALIAAAGWAPFHRPCHAARTGADVAPEPWRFHVLDASACRALIPALMAQPEAPSKIANMLAGADALILATWLPEPTDGPGWEASTFNAEHIAATAAAIQTLLLAATERGIENYWSSGGVLAKPDAFALMGIPAEEQLCGAIFLFPAPPEGVDAAAGKMRVKRSDPARWARRVTL